MTGLSIAVRRAAALGILAALGMLVSVAVLPLAAEYGRARDSVQQLQDSLTRYRAMAARTDGLRQRLTAMQGDESSRRSTMTAATDTLAAAELQNIIKSLAGANRGVLRSTQVLPARDQDGFRRIAVRVQMTIGLEDLQHVLYTLQTSSPVILIDSIDLRVRKQIVEGRVSDDGELLDSLFEMSAFLRSKQS